MGSNLNGTELFPSLLRFNKGKCVIVRRCFNLFPPPGNDLKYTFLRKWYASNETGRDNVQVYVCVYRRWQESFDLK